jgi:hypothetical protein
MEPTSEQFISGPHFQRYNLIEIGAKKEVKMRIEKKTKKSDEFLTHDLKTLRYFYRHTIIACCEKSLLKLASVKRKMHYM